MRKFNIKSAVVLFFFFMAAGFCFLTCDSKPTEPKPEEEKDYVFYFNEATYSDQYFRYHSATQKVDSLIIPNGSLYKSFAVSADGSRLYLPDGFKVVVVSTDSFEVVTELNYSGDVSVSPDGRYVAITGYDINILSTEDYSVVFHDTSNASSGVFSQNSQTFYCGNSPFIFKVDLTTLPFNITKTQLPYPELKLRQMIPSVDETKWFLYRKIIGSVFVFEVYDVALDSLVFSNGLVPGYGEIVVSPDGKYVFYTNPGELNTDVPPPSSFTVFDIEKNENYKTIETSSPMYNDHLIVGELAITPDGKKLVVLGARGTGTFVVINTSIMEQTEHYYLGQENVNYVGLWNVTCQNGN